MASVAHARRIADEETAAIAEHYRSNPLLEGMSVPRVRVPEIQLDLPLLVESYSEPAHREYHAPEVIEERLLSRLQRSAAADSFEIPEGFGERFRAALHKRLLALSHSARAHPEGVVRAMDTAFADTERRLGQKRWLDPAQRKELLEDLRQEASESAMAKEGSSPQISVTIATSQVKEGASAACAPRLRLILKEEGVEWTVTQNETGETARTLTPE